jgi:hypothetical protein
MQPIHYNDIDFTVEEAGDRWDIRCTRADGAVATVATGLFAGLPEGEAHARALALIETVFPVGVKSVGPDVTHPNTVGDLKIVGPDVAHPNFVYWDKDSVSCPKKP